MASLSEPSFTSSGRRQFVSLVRHGESLAQGTHRTLRRTEAYLDCACSPKGVAQAYALPDRFTAHGGVGGVELVVVSPLTRALTTALLGFRDRKTHVPMLVHPACRETGTGIPENVARAVASLQLDKDLASLPGFNDLDFGLLPPDWPINDNGGGAANCGGSSGRSGGRSKRKGEPTRKGSRGGRGSSGFPMAEEHDPSRGLLAWLRARPETRIVVVCHHNYISALVRHVVKVENASPIECVLDDHGFTLAHPAELEGS